MLLGSGLSALCRASHIGGFVTALLVAGLVVANNPSLVPRGLHRQQLTQPAALPSYQLAAIKHLNATHPGTRVFAIPGNDFAGTAGGTRSTPRSRPSSTGTSSRGAADPRIDRHRPTLYATDGPLQDGTANLNAPGAFPAVGAGDLMVEYDQQYERYGRRSPTLALQRCRRPSG